MEYQKNKKFKRMKHQKSSGRLQKEEGGNIGNYGSSTTYCAIISSSILREKKVRFPPTFLGTN